ncbi:hypothetical protein [Alteromonas gilva]|uniref:Uncharacterized protein n=1 Tax=Alteromonas gilva TaxID=2987522 RepID=A0ABT5L8S2_9ALTE|nr:hypothetical protein [Alteromonas gilva]MDC8832944.1 hypothetical protein [Alteromonas gilva]
MAIKPISESEALRDINARLELYCETNNRPKLTVTGFYSGYQLDKSICHVTCEEHGSGDVFGAPWRPRLNHLRRSKDLEAKNIGGCPKCSGNYRYTESEHIEQLESILSGKGLKLIGFMPGKVNRAARCKISCKDHGNGWEWDNPWEPAIDKLLQGKGCPKCSGKYKAPVEENIKDVNLFLAERNPHLVVIGIVGKYIGKASKVKVECQKHGKGWLFGKPWTPTFESLFLGCGCPKCSQTYNPTEVEVLQSANELLDTTSLKLIGFKGTYKGAHSRCILHCEFHGNLSNYDDYAFPKLDHITNALQTCYKCAKERHTLLSTLRHPQHFEKTRKLYFVELADQATEKVLAYKVGLTFSKISQRFNHSRLQERQLKIARYQMIELPNIVACLAEVMALAFHSKKVIYFERLHNWGATECFSKDVLGIDSELGLKELVSNSLSYFECVLKTTKLSRQEQLLAMKAWRKIDLHKPNQGLGKGDLPAHPEVIDECKKVIESLVA